MAKELRNTTVLSKQTVTPNMIRLTLAGDCLADFPQGYEGGYIKVMLNDDSGDKIARSFTIRKFNPAGPWLTIELVSHGDHGPAARWISKVKAGDDVAILGPGACKRLNQDADWFLLAGDMTALPAISVNLELLPEDARGIAVLEVLDEADKVELAKPENVEVIWLENNEPEANLSPLSDAVQNLTWLEGQPSTWVAGEFNTSRNLRQFFRHKMKIDKDFMYVSCYWKIGDTDEGMKAAKRNDAEAW